MAICHDEMNNRALRAWNAWKDVCWVHGIGKSQNDGMTVIGTKEDEDILVGELTRSFKRHLDPYMHLLIDGENKSMMHEVDFAQEFDDALAAYELSETKGHERYYMHCYGDPKKIRKAKAWKDFVWNAVAESTDPPLKVIRGMLTATDGIMKTVVEEWLLSNFSCHKIGKRFVQFDISRDALKAEGRESNAEKSDVDEESKIDDEKRDCDDLEETDIIVVGENVDIPNTWILELEQTFSYRICCIIFAHIKGLKLYKENEILNALDIKKSKAAEELKNLEKNYSAVLSQLNPELREWIIKDATGTRFFLNWIKNRCSAEKAGQMILYRIAAMGAE